MSNDARYILVYEALPYLDPTPMDIDKKYLEENYGGCVEKIDFCTFYWDKPKHKLPRDCLKELKADQVLERADCELYEIIK